MNSASIYNGYVYFGQGSMENGHLSDPGYVWAWDIATGVTRTGYPLGPTDSGINSYKNIGVAHLGDCQC